MSAYENAVVGRLKLKGKALDVRDGIRKKKKQKHHYNERFFHTRGTDMPADGSPKQSVDPSEDVNEAFKSGKDGHRAAYNDHLTPVERRYFEQRQKFDMRRLARVAAKSHRDRIQEFNEYLANLSEHYDIPKVGPG